MRKQKAEEDRREVLKSISLFLGYTITSGVSSAFLSGCKPKNIEGWTPTTLTNEELLFIKAITERILPRTDTPGATDAKVYRYIDEVISNFYSKEEREVFLTNIHMINTISREKYKKLYTDLNDRVKDDVLNMLAAEWKTNKEEEHIFKELRDLTVTGFATSEIGAKQFFIYDQIPGPYIGCIPYEDVGGTYSL